jgi:CubicO group peptidase (beta-lactamase class C family)
MKYYLIPCFLFIAFLLPKPALAQTIVPKELDLALSKVVKSNDPGFALSIVKHGQVKYAHAFGMADLAGHRQNNVATPFDIASASKQFTAVCIYLLEQQGKLKTSDKLSKYFPDFPAYADTITIAHLIHHQSGLRDYLTLFALQNMKENAAFDDADAYAKLSRQKRLNFQPGAQYSYSNSGYFLLSMIVKQVSGQDLQEFAQANIFRPLKMYHTAFSHSHKVADKANAYVFDGESYSEFNPVESTIGHSHVYSPVTDWQRWFNEMNSHKLLGHALWAKMLNPASTSNGTVTEYAGGLLIGNYKDKMAIYHGGDLFGYHSRMIWFPQEDLGIIVLTNDEAVSADNVVDVVYSSIYKTAKTAAPARPVKTKPKATQSSISIVPNRYIGIYRDNGNPEQNFEVTAKDSNLVVTQLWNLVTYPIVADNDSLFHIAGVDGITFNFKDTIAGKAGKMELSEKNKLSHYTRLKKPLTPDQATINGYLGRYYGEEIETYYTVFQDAGKLKIKMGEMELSLARIGEKENYHIVGIDMSLLFHRNKEAKIDGMDVEHIRIKGLHLVKQDL